ncbi:MAG: tetratricopeptide repeat protein [Blastocatellia bacterium]|nr:tetratricopeptide repeat protein [Blastocatellia bacterium]
MSKSRIEVFRTMVEKNPNDVMVWYGLANEYLKQEQFAEAVEALRQTLRLNPDYTAAYQMLGSALQNLGDEAEAVRIWQEGIETANRTGAWKARQHMESLLNQTKSGGFCS